MCDEDRLFLNACGATGPLRFEWADQATGEAHAREFESPSLVLGRDPSADLVLDDPSLEPRHALLQIIDGRLFAIDLESSEGLRWGNVPRGSGWVERGQTLRLGRFTLRLLGGDHIDPDMGASPPPTSSRYASRRNLPGVVLDFRNAKASKNDQILRGVLDRVFLMAGSSERCKLRFEGTNVPKFICALIQTPRGVWLTNVSSTEGATVNGAYCRSVRLEDGDVVRVGRRQMRILYDGASKAQVERSLFASPSKELSVARRPLVLEEAAADPAESLPESILQALLERGGPEPAQASSPFGQALILMVRLLGDVHRDHLTLVRDELAQIRRLSHEMEALRARIPREEPVRERTLFAPAPSPNDAEHVAEPEVERIDVPRPGPEAAREIVSERLEAWEKERRSRWRRLMRLIVQS